MEPLRGTNHLLRSLSRGGAALTPGSGIQLLRGKDRPRPPHHARFPVAGHFLEELRTTFADRARHPALLYRGATFTYADLEQRALKGAAWLQTRGLEPGD